MEMVSAVKMRRAQEHVLASRPYSDRMRVLLGHLATHQPPTRQYLNCLLNGAKQAQLPDAYIETLQRIETLR